MSLDAQHTQITKPGRVTIEADGSVHVEGFEAENASCRDVGVLACLWAARLLMEQAMAGVEKPGLSAVCVD